MEAAEVLCSLGEVGLCCLVEGLALDPSDPPWARYFLLVRALDLLYFLDLAYQEVGRDHPPGILWGRRDPLEVDLVLRDPLKGVDSGRRDPLEVDFGRRDPLMEVDFQD